MHKQIMTAAMAVALTVVQASMAADAPAPAQSPDQTPAVTTAPPTQAPPTPQQPQQDNAVATRVVVLPFTEANDQQHTDWIGRAIYQAVVDDLSALSEVEVVSYDPAAANPTPAQARAAGIKYIVRGTIQRNAGELRVSGRVVNVEDGKSAGGFKATGMQQQLFAIEDSLTQQLTRILAPMEALPTLEIPQPTGLTSRGGYGGGNTLPAQPNRGGVYEGSDLQRALDDRDFINRAARRGQTFDPPPVYTPQQPTYPVTYGVGGTVYPPVYPGYPYGGYGYGYGYGWGNGTDVIIVNPGNNHGTGGGSIPSGPTLQERQTARIRDAAVNGGSVQSNVVGPIPHRPPAPGTKNP